MSRSGLLALLIEATLHLNEDRPYVELIEDEVAFLQGKHVYFIEAHTFLGGGWIKETV